MGALQLLLLFAITVKTDQTALREGCESNDATITQLSAGIPLEIRFAMNGCYKVAVSTQGKTMLGYLPAGAIAGIEEFEKARQSAPAVISSEPAQPVSKSGMPTPRVTGRSDHPLVQASSLLEQNQPAAALEIVEKGLRVYGRDYQFLVLAGLAAYRADEVRRALDYLKEAYALHQDRSVEVMIAKLEKEAAGDKSGLRLYGNRFLLRYEGTLDQEIARTMVATLEEEFSRVASQLGCRTDERISTIIQSRQAYRASTDAAEWSGGQYDGKIRIPYAETKVITPELRRTFTHELVHACLANMGRYPAWLHEGLAQKLSGDTLKPRLHAQFRSMARDGKMPKLENLSQSWARMSAQHAAVAYAYSLAAVDILMQEYQAYGIQNVLRNTDRLPQITADLDRRLAE